MEQRKIPLIDRLWDRGFIDQWGFALLAFVGGALIISAKWFGVEGHWVTGGAISLMLIYALIISKAGTGRLRADQAGDNCYYLGLIYTLASLSFAIAFFDPDNSATTIIQGFGVALGTTVVGLVLRVFFSQGRPDLENIEENTRLELTEATSKLKTELSQAVASMNGFVRQVRQSLDEMSETTRQDIENVAASSITDVRTVVGEATGGIREVVGAATQAIRDEANDFAARSKRYSTTFDGLLKKLDGHAENIDRITASHETLAAAAESSSQVATQALATVGSLNEHTTTALAAVQALKDSGALVGQRLDQLRQAIAPIEGAVTVFQADAMRQLAELRTAPGEAVQAATKILLDAATSLELQIAEVANLHQRTTETIAKQAESALGVTQRHNEQLDEQLRRSRQMVAEVQASVASVSPPFPRSVEAGA